MVNLLCEELGLSPNRVENLERQVSQLMVEYINYPGRALRVLLLEDFTVAEYIYLSFFLGYQYDIVYSEEDGLITLAYIMYTCGVPHDVNCDIYDEETIPVEDLEIPEDVAISAFKRILKSVGRNVPKSIALKKILNAKAMELRVKVWCAYTFGKFCHVVAQYPAAYNQVIEEFENL